MILVALSIAVLFAAPAIAHVLARSASLAQLLDSFVLVAVGGIVALHVVPQSAGIAGPAALIAVAVGVFLPVLLHRVDDALMRPLPSPLLRRGGALSAPAPKAPAPIVAARDVVLLVVFAAGIFVHGMFDGTALAGSVATPALAVAVLLHRLPVGLALWTVVRPKLGIARMLIIVAAYGGGTVTGAVIGGALLTGASAPLLAVVQAFVAGSILHIVAESPPYASVHGATRGQPSSPHWLVRVAGIAGALLAGIVLYGVEHLDGEHAAPLGLGASDAFLALALQTAPAALLSFLLVGVVSALYPDSVPGITGRGSRVVDAGLGAAAGLPHPLCSCSVAPLYETLVERGASPAAARAFLVAAPELGVPAILVSARLLGLPFTVARVVGAAALAVLVGVSARGAKSTVTSSRVGAFSARLASGMRHGLKDAVDHVGPWLALGLAVSALLEAALPETALTSWPAPVITALLAVAAAPLYLCAAGATPVAAVLVHKGATAGAALAFLLVGPATSLPTLSLIKRLHGPRAAAWFAILVVAGALVVGFVVDAVVAQGLLSAPAVVIEAPAALSDPWSLGRALDALSLVTVLALLLSSLFRQGVRGFLVQIMSPQHSHAADHDHGPGCAHDHGPPVARIALSFDPRGQK